MARFDFDDLRSWAHDLGVALTDHQLAQLREYVGLLETWNRRVRLVSSSEPELVLTKHVADSLVPSKLCRAGDRVVDLGSGAGFPGIPMAVARPDVEFVLVESNRRRISFLTEAVRVARLTGVSVVEGRIESAARTENLKGRNTFAIARALASLAELIEYARPLLDPDGRLVAMKSLGYARELAEVEAAQRGQFVLDEVISYRLPDDSERALLVIRFT